MIKKFQRERFALLSDDPPFVVENIELHKCEFDQCSFSSTLDAQRRSQVRNILLRDCTVARSRIGAAVIDEVVVDGLKTRGLLQLWAPALRHVTLRGRLGRLMVSPDVAPMTANASQQRAFEEANRRWYESVDWALDVREAECEELDLGGVPGRLVRRDPRDAVLVTREVALRGAWRKLDLAQSWWAVALDRLVKSSMDSAALVAPRRHPSYRRQVEALQVLRDEGIAEPD